MAESKPSRAVIFVSADDIADVAEWLRQDSGETDAGWVERLTAYFAALRADPVRAAEEMKERCLKAAVNASYGPPSSWPGDYPKGWRHPPTWDGGRTPTPHEAAWHDNGARDAWFAIRTLPIQPAAEGGAE